MKLEKAKRWTKKNNNKKKTTTKKNKKNRSTHSKPTQIQITGNSNGHRK